MTDMPVIAAKLPAMAEVPGVVEAIDGVGLEWRGQFLCLRGGTAHIAAGIAPVRSAMHGTLLSDKHPLVKARPELFRPFRVSLDDVPL